TDLRGLFDHGDACLLPLLLDEWPPRGRQGRRRRSPRRCRCSRGRSRKLRRWSRKSACAITEPMSANHPLSDAEALAALDCYRPAGVDVAVAAERLNRFATPAVLRPKRALPGMEPRPAPVPAAPLVADPSETRALAQAAPTLEALRAAMDAYDGCALKHRATQLCFSDGNPEAQIMLVGEGPGEQEDKQGKPFVGRGGQLLDRMLGAIGLDRSKVFIVNMVPWRPPGNRNPTPDELALCTPFVVRQVELVNPKLLVT